MLATPEFEGVERFRKEANSLPELKVATGQDLVFVNLAPECAALSDTLDDLPARLAARDFSGFRLAARKEWQIECNWKVYVDNYLEGYHIPIVHPSLNREIDYRQYRTETRRFCSIQHSPIKPVDSGRLHSDESGAGTEVQYYWVFPNLMLNVYPDNYSTNLILPLEPSRTRAVFEWYFRNPEQSDVQESARH